MQPVLIASADDVIEQLLVLCWLFEARAGRRTQARAKAERTLERLLGRGLPFGRAPGGALRLDPYRAVDALRTRIGEPADEAWADWLFTCRRNATSLPAAPHRYRFTMRREWHAVAGARGAALALRLPLPIRGERLGAPQVRLVEPASGACEIRVANGRIELQLDAASTTDRPIVAESEVTFTAGEVRDPMTGAAPLGVPVDPGDSIWLRDREGLIAPSAAVTAWAARLAHGCADARELIHAVWEQSIGDLRFGDVHRGDLDERDPLGSVLRTGTADCVLGSSLLVAACRARGVPARLVSGFLIHPANPGPHSWAEVRVAPDTWVPVDFGSWCYCAGDSGDPDWGRFFCGRVDARLVAEVAPREFTGWGSATPPARWYRLERLREDGGFEHTLHALPDGRLVRRDVLYVQVLGPVEA